jgi:hypothetical protein
VGFEGGENFLCVALGFYVGEDFDEGLVGADDEGGAGDSPDFLAIHVLLLHDAKLIADLFVYICKEWVREAVFLLEVALGFGCVAADAEDDGAGGLEFGEGVAEAASLNGAAGGVGPGVKEEDDGFAGEVGEVDGVLRIVLESEVGYFFVQLHWGILVWLP